MYTRLHVCCLFYHFFNRTSNIKRMNSQLSAHYMLDEGGTFERATAMI